MWYQHTIGRPCMSTPGFKYFHHLRFSSTNKGHIFARMKSDAPEVDFNLLKHEWSVTNCYCPARVSHPFWTLPHLPVVPLPQGRSTEEAKNVTCPKLSVPDPLTKTTTPTTCHQFDHHHHHHHLHNPSRFKQACLQEAQVLWCL